jgi:hypothetical protein
VAHETSPVEEKSRLEEEHPTELDRVGRGRVAGRHEQIGGDQPEG